MANNWTNEQMSAITSRGSNLLVSAAAGSGKTAVLVERIIQMITKDNVDIDKVLVVTFTNAAAAEMRERIGEAIIRSLDENPANKNLERQLSLLNRSSIMTMHSFCLEIIRNNFHTIGIDPGFRISDETEGAILREECIEDALEEYYEKNDKGFIDLVDSYGGKKDDKELVGIILNLHRFIMSNPWPVKWLDEKVEQFNLSGKNLMDLPVLENLSEEILNVLVSYEESLEEALDIVRNHEPLKGYEQALLDDINIYMVLKDALEQKRNFNDIKAYFDSVSWTSLKRGKTGYDKTLAEEVKSLRGDFKSFIGEVRDKYFFETEEDNILIINNTYPKLKALAGVTKLFMEKYDEKKREKNILDFSDLEHLALRILTKTEEGEVYPSETAMEYKAKFAEVLVDEYQDSNEVQEVLISMVSRKDDLNPNVFMVGDVKQSIYRFRQAKPELFMEKYRSYNDGIADKGKKILLYKNFRSRKNILSSVNFLFKGIMSERVGELDYTDEEALIYGASYDEDHQDEDKNNEGIRQPELKDDPIEIMLVEEKDSDEENSSSEESDEGENTLANGEIDPDEYKAIEVEAKMVAEKINELIRSRFQVYDRKTKGNRDITYRDIVILMRATSGSSAIFLEELHGSNIPSFSDNALGYFDTIEIRTMVSLLNVIDNPYQDVPLIATLRSPIFSFGEDDLVEIRKVNDKEYFYKNLLNAEELKGELKDKVEYFKEKLEEYRNLSKLMKLDEFVWFLYTDTSYYDYVGAMPDGIERQANLRILFQRARQFEETSLKGLFNFVRFIDKLKKTTGDIGAAKILGENENLVRIMSIHKSKGLEFPVVFLCNASKRFNKMDLNKQIILHETLGFGPNYIDLDRGITNTTLIKEVIKNKINLESISEEMRILYVALTRAKEKLIITAQVKDLEKSLKKWTDLSTGNEFSIGEEKVIKAASYLDWLMAVLLKHRDFTEYRTDEKKFNYGNEVNIKLTVHKKTGILNLTEAEKHKPSGMFTLDLMNDPENSFEVNQRLNYRYAYLDDTLRSSKISVTELKRLENLMNVDEPGESLFKEDYRLRPEFMMEKTGLTGAEKGTAFHKVMQYLDFQRVSLAEIKEQLIEFKNKELIHPEEIEAINPFKVKGIFETELGQRMKKADKENRLKRESKFLMHLDHSDVIVIGVIDCYFEEDGGLILIDYKTDYVPGENFEEELKTRYHEQLYYYKDALETITGKPTTEIYLFSVQNEREILLS